MDPFQKAHPTATAFFANAATEEVQAGDVLESFAVTPRALLDKPAVAPVFKIFERLGGLAGFKPEGLADPLPGSKAPDPSFCNNLRPGGPTHLLDMCQPFRLFLFFALFRWLSPPAEDVSAFQAW